MKLSEHIFVDHLHHAYLIEGERVSVIKELLALFVDFGIPTEANPDLHLIDQDVFLIHDAHELRREQSFHASEGSRKIFLVAFNTMTSEAQNALLKTIEEPTERTHFFFITRTGATLFPTVRSRLQTIRHTDGEKAEALTQGEAFCVASIPLRLRMIEAFTKAKADDKPQAKEEAREFLCSLERALYGKIDDEENSRSLRAVIAAKKYVNDRGPSVKLLLEHLALTIPRGNEKKVEGARK